MDAFESIVVEGNDIGDEPATTVRSQTGKIGVERFVGRRT